MMLVRFSLVVCFALGVLCDWNGESQNEQAERDVSPRDRRFFLTALAQRRPITNSINQMSKIAVDEMRAQTQLINSGLNTMSNQLNNLKVSVAQQTATAIENGRQILRTAVEQVSLPVVVATTSLAINGLNAYLKKSGMEVQTLPALTASLWGFGTLQSSEGQLAKLSTLVQDGKITVNMTGRALLVGIPIRLSELSVTYPHYNFSSWGINIEGNITAKVQDNGLLARIKVLNDQGCAVNVERVEVIRFRGIDINMSGLCSYCSSIASFIANYLQGVIQNQVQAAIDNGLRSLFAAKGRQLLCSQVQAAS